MVDKPQTPESSDRESGSKLPARLGRNLATRRKLLSLTQAQVAERVGVDTETLSRFERGKHVPSLVTLERLAAVLSSTVADLLQEAPKMPATDAAVMASWMSGLTVQDQKFARQMLKACCDHLAAKY